jgi:sulfate adenylyltransferase subunit 1 (EFTu-like GTPase family)
MNDIIEARIFGLGRHPLAPGREFRLKLAAQETLFTVERIEKVIDSSTLETLVERHDRVESHEVAEVVLKTARPLLFDNFTDVVETGRFVVVDDGVIGVGRFFTK